MLIDGKEIGLDNRPFIIAELSGNHNQSLERALMLVEMAAKSGVQAVKIQTYTADTMTLDLKDEDFYVSDDSSLWKGNTLYQLYQKAYTPWEWHRPIFDRCEELGLVGFSTPFDESAVEFLESMNPPCYKIASFENTDIPLIKKVASTGKPMIISTGMASVSELDETVRVARKEGCKDLILLKCTSTYPASAEESNLVTIPNMRSLFNCEVGLSDHTLGIGVALASISLGASVIEKHFTIRRSDGGVDSAFSMEPEEMSSLVKESERAWSSLGKIVYGPTENEKKSLKFRRSLYIAEDIKAGEILTRKNLKSLRPGNGLSPRFYDVILGKKINRDVKRGTPVTWDLIG